MISFSILVLHFLLLIVAFVRGIRLGGVKEGTYSAIFVVIIFSVAWALGGFLANLFFPPEGLGTFYQSSHDPPLILDLNRDTLSLVIATAIEIVFYITYFRGASGERNQ